MPHKKNISSQHIKQARLAKGLTSTTFCSECANNGSSINSQELEQIEAGDYEVSDVMLETIAKVLDVTVTSLIFGDQDIEQPSN